MSVTSGNCRPGVLPRRQNLLVREAPVVKRFSLFADPHRPLSGSLVNDHIGAFLCEFGPPLPPVLFVVPDSCYVAETRIDRRDFHKEDRR